jgi:hypothetical protein
MFPTRHSSQCAMSQEGHVKDQSQGGGREAHPTKNPLSRLTHGHLATDAQPPFDVQDPRAEADAI